MRSKKEGMLCVRLMVSLCWWVDCCSEKFHAQKMEMQKRFEETLAQRSKEYEEKLGRNHRLCYILTTLTTTAAGSELLSIPT